MKFQTQSFRALTNFSLMLACALALASCATSGNRPNTRTADASGIEDPMEGYNRFMFKVNDAVDRAVFEPVARGYRYVAPKPVRKGVSNFLKNLKSPVNIANQLLQGDLEGAGNDFVRFAVNTTVGIGGLIDVAGENGYKYEQEDFGQTLASWGVGHGAYFVIPLLGPSSLRDATGMLVDSFADPLNIYLYNTDHEEWVYARWGLTFLSAREELLDAVSDLRKHSLDYYASTRSAYAQRREALVKDQKPDSGASPSIPDYSRDR